MIGNSDRASGVSADQRARRRRALGRAAVAGVIVAMDLAFLAISSIGWLSTDVAEVAGLTLFGASAALGIPVGIVIASASASTARAIRAGGSLVAASRRASLGLLLAFLRLPLLAGAVALVAALTTETPDGRWKIDEVFIGFAVVDVVAALLVASLAKADASRSRPT